VSPSLTQSSKQRPSIFTFDLFDTLITRNVLRPEDIFKKVGRRLRAAALWSHSEERFSRERIAAGTRTLRRLRVEEITLTQIYETLAANAGWSEEQAVQAMALEIEEELAAMRPIAEMRDRFNALDTASKAIVSDTYYSQSTIKQMLERCGIECPPDRVFLSSTLDKRKSTGRLFPYVAQQLDTATGDILHTGDNEHSDLKSAQSQGFAAERYIGSRPNRYESILRAADPDIDTSISGALRIARLAFSKGSEINRARAVGHRHTSRRPHSFWIRRLGARNSQDARHTTPLFSCARWSDFARTGATDRSHLTYVVPLCLTASLASSFHRFGSE
jgi:predicted HAD superfamily hydrolase